MNNKLVANFLDLFSNTRLSVFILASIVIFTAISFYVSGQSLVGIDDANIYMVYMKNFANGHGFVYNPGGERVEGFTSFLWTLIGGVLFYMSNNKEWTLLALNLILIIYLFFRLAHFLQVEENKRIKPETALFIGILCVTPGFFDWTILSLMETGLWTVLLTLIIINIIELDTHYTIKSYWNKMSILLALLVLCRPESILWGAMFLFFMFIKVQLNLKNVKETFKLLLKPTISFAIVLIGLVLWRILYFGYPFPNTYYAKVSADRISNLLSGTQYVINCLVVYPIVFVSFILLLFESLKFVIKVWRSKGNSALKEIKNGLNMILLLFVFILTFFFPLFSGGDHFAYCRFLQPSLPILILAIFIVLKQDKAKLTFKYAIGVLTIVFFSFSFNLLDIHYDKNSPIRIEFSIVGEGRKQSKKLNMFFKKVPKLPSQGVVMAGSTAYMYEGETIDLMGLNNTAMAHSDKIKDHSLMKNHQSFNKSIFYQQLPDIRWLNSKFTAEDSIPFVEITSFDADVFKNVQKEDKFKSIYGYYLISQSSIKENFLIFAKHDFVNSLPIDTYKVLKVEYE